jgi:hypothetical protein
VVGVQWHPEQDEADRRLFRALAGAATMPRPAEALEGTPTTRRTAR